MPHAIAGRAADWSGRNQSGKLGVAAGLLNEGNRVAAFGEPLSRRSKVCSRDATVRRCLMGGMDVTEPIDAGAVAGDVESAWRDLGPGAFRLAAVLVGPHDAHDITTAAFLRVTSQPGWGEVVDQRAYLFRAVRNEAQNLYRAQGRRWRRDLAAVRPATVDDRPVDVDVYRALARLSLRQRSVVFMAYWQDMSEAEIGEVLGLSRGTVHRDLRLARDRIRKELS